MSTWAILVIAIAIIALADRMFEFIETVVGYRIFAKHLSETNANKVNETTNNNEEEKE